MALLALRAFSSSTFGSSTFLFSKKKCLIKRLKNGPVELNPFLPFSGRQQLCIVWAADTESRGHLQSDCDVTPVKFPAPTQNGVHPQTDPTEPTAEIN